MEEYIYIFLSFIFLIFGYIFLNKKGSKNLNDIPTASEKLENLGKEYLNHLTSNFKQTQEKPQEQKQKNTTTIDNNNNNKNINIETNNNQIKTENKTENKTDNNNINMIQEYNFIPNFTIIYGTNGGHSKKFAKNLLKVCQSKYHLICNVINISQITDIDIFNTSHLLIFIVSTYGDGDPTDDAFDFTEMIEEDDFWKDFKNENFRYAIFGLGDSSYEKFNAQSKRLNKIFKKQKLNSLCDLTLGDDSKDIDNDFENWKEKIFFPNLISFYKQKNVIYNSNNSNNESEIKLEKEKKNLLNVNNKNYEYEIEKYLESSEVKINNIKELRQSNENGSTLLIDFKIDNKHNLKNIKTISNIQIYPKNSKENVKFIIDKMKYNKNLYVNYNNDKKNNLKFPIPIGMTIEEVLVNIIDITGPLSKNILKEINNFCFNWEQKNQINSIVSDDKKFKEFSQYNFNFVDLIKEYDSILIPFENLCTILPKIFPRTYTCCYSCLINSNNNNNIIYNDKSNCDFSTAIALVAWKNYLNEIRLGLTSEFFYNIYSQNIKNSRCKIIINQNKQTFKLPNNIHSPILMICTGTGINPFIAFLNELKILNDLPYETYLIFGSKNEKSDFIFKKDLDEFLKDKILTKLYTAFSRDQKEKVYVQDVFEKNFEKNKILDLLFNKNMIIYCCGSLSMGNSINKKIEEIIGKENYEKIIKNGQYISEFWGK